MGCHGMNEGYRYFVEYEGWFEFSQYNDAAKNVKAHCVPESMIEAYIPGIGWTRKFERPALKPSGTEAKVCEDIAKRQQIGIAKYRTTVVDNPLSLREWLNHAYQECLDQAVYLKRAIQDLDAKQNANV